MTKQDAALLPAIFLLCGAEFLQSGMTAFAAAPIMGEIGAGPEEFSVIASLYACVAVFAIAKQHWLVERIGWRRYFGIGALLYFVGAQLCAYGSHLTMFAVGRILMALGGGGLMSAARLLVNLRAPGLPRFRGVQIFACGLSTGMALAPLLASWAITNGDRALIFEILTAVVLLGCALAAKAAPAHIPQAAFVSQSGGGRVLLLATSSFLFLYLLQRSYYDFYNDAAILTTFLLLSAAGIYAFLHTQYHHDAPLLRVREVVSRRYVVGMMLFGTGYVLLGANNYMIPIFLQRGLGYSWETTGELQAGGLASSVLAWGLMSFLIPKSPALTKFLVCGVLCLIGFGLQMALVSPDADLLQTVLPALLLNGCFVILTLATAAIQTFRDMQGKDHLFAPGYQLKSMLAQLAIALGTSLSTLLLQWRSTVQYDHIAARIHSGSAPYLDYLQRTTEALRGQGAGTAAARMALAKLGQDVSQQATLLAGIEYFRLVSIIGVALLLLLVWRESTKRLRSAAARQ